MADIKLFPSGIALGSTFCNREVERKYLKQCFDNNEHVVLVSPRRYGKTSLIAKVIEDTQIYSVSIDFLLASDAKYIEGAILSGVGELCSILLQNHSSLKEKLFGIFSNFSPKLTLSALGQKLELSSKGHSVQNISEALLSLEVAAQESKQKIVFVMDEFQQIASLQNHSNIEASIRHAVERSKSVTYVFSGSNRHLLEQMFNDKSRPLYHLCELMRLDRIKPEFLINFIGASSEKKWQKKLTEEALAEIMLLTQRHTYYVNRLCRALWKNKVAPNVADIRQYWHEYVYSQKWVVNDLGKLSVNQRKILTALVKEPTGELYGQYIRIETGLTPSSITKTISSLEKLDMIYEDHKGVVHVLDPAIYYFILTKNFINRET